MKRSEEIRAAIEVIARAMVEHKNQVVVTCEQRGPEVNYLVVAAQPDIRRLVGTSGSNFNALSTLVWSMGNQEPRIKTRLLPIEPAVEPTTAQEPGDDFDPVELFNKILFDMRLPAVSRLTTSQMRAVLERAGDQADELRSYLLAMRSDLADDVRRLLERR